MVTKWDRVRNDRIQRREGMENSLTEKVDGRVLLWFGHVKGNDMRRWPRKIRAASVVGSIG